MPVRPVKAMIVPAPAPDRVLTYSGVIAPRIESTLGFRVSGKIVERFVNVGDRITAGQKIARLDEVDLKLAENSARAAVDGRKDARHGCQGCAQASEFPVAEWLYRKVRGRSAPARNGRGSVGARCGGGPAQSGHKRHKLCNAAGRTTTG